MGSTAEELAAGVLPPRRGAIIALNVTTTAYSYALNTLDFAGNTPEAAATRSTRCFLTLQASGADVWFYFHTDSEPSPTLDNTAKVTANNALAYSNAYGWRIPDGQSMSFEIDRAKDKYLVCKTASSTSTLLLACSSEVR